MATTAPDRIVTLDIVRGVAVIGIFFANILSMGLPEDAVLYPATYGFAGIGDRLAWLFNWLFIDNRMRGLFTILFGASLVLIADRAVARGRSPWRVHLPRLATLLLIGLAHHFFLWTGDILSMYALVGLVALLFIDADADKLWRGAIILLAINAAIMCGLVGLAALGGGFAPGALDPAVIAAERAAQAGPLAHAAYQWSSDPFAPLVNALIFLMETCGLMLLGMALLKSGFLAGAAPDRTYRRWLVALPLLWLLMLGSAALVIASGYDSDLLVLLRTILGTAVTPAIAIGYAALVIRLARAGGDWTLRLAATGRAAFTNYLGASILMTPLMFGPWWGDLSRGQLWLIAPPMGLLMLLWSKPWLDRYSYGPLEWIWRSLSRGRVERLRR